MRISKESLEALRAACQPLDTESNRAAYRADQFPRADRCKDKNMRYRWDILWASRFDVSALYRTENLNDSHIDTALRSIIPAL